jgi:uncharacterized protein YjbI with pentapeptide repeats
MGTYFQDARLWEAHLEGAVLWQAHLEGAELSGAHLEGAQLHGAHLQGAVLIGTNLELAEGLSSNQLLETEGDPTTKLPKGMIRPATWSLEDQIWSSFMKLSHHPSRRIAEYIAAGLMERFD